jgi:hypothetical protein
VVEQLLVAPSSGALHAGAKPVHHHRLAAVGHLRKPFAKLARLVMKLPSGWQKPRAASSGSSRSMLSPTSVLEMPTARPARRDDSPSSSTDPTASRRTSRASGGVPPWPGGRAGCRWPGDGPARPAPVRAATNVGSMPSGPDLQAGFENPPMVWSPSTSGHTGHHGHPQWADPTVGAGWRASPRRSRRRAESAAPQAEGHVSFAAVAQPSRTGSSLVGIPRSCAELAGLRM